MRCWRRLVATILLLTLLPGSFAAALPLVYCVSLDGQHRAVEFVDDCSDHHHQFVVGESGDDTALEKLEGCVDYQVAPLAGAPSREMQPSALSTASWQPPPSVAILNTEVFSLANLGAEQRLRAHWTRPALALLTARKTIVLQI